MRIQLVTFGGLRVLDNTTQLELSLMQRSRAALFIYLTIERRVARDALTAMFWPESDSANAKHALRQSLYHVTKVLGCHEWLDSRACEILVRDGVRADTIAFEQAIDCGHNELASRLYQGPFLGGVHLVDLPSWESWVDARRAKYARAFRKVCRELLDSRLAARDFAGAIAVGERWTAPDPTDDEAQHRFITTLALAGEPGEAVRQYETYERLLAREELQPLDETRQLIEQLRANRRRQGRRPSPVAYRTRQNLPGRLRSSGDAS